MKVFSFILLSVVTLFMFFVEINFVLTVMDQHAAESFSKTQGIVISSEVIITHGSKGSVHYHISIAYSYQVDGQGYQSRRYRYDNHPDDSSAVDALVSAHPRNSGITVYYDPKNPYDAVLSPLVDAEDVSRLFFFAPVCLLFTWLFRQLARQIDWPWDSTIAGGAKVIVEGMITRIRLPRYPWYIIGGAVAGASCLVAGLVLETCFVLIPPLIMGGWLLLAVLSASAGACLWCFQRAQSGRLDLIIDEGSRTVQLPLTLKRREQSPQPFSHIKAVAVDKIRSQSRSSAYYVYVVTLKMTDNSNERLAIMTESRANSLAAWLKQKFNLSRQYPNSTDEN